MHLKHVTLLLLLLSFTYSNSSASEALSRAELRDALPSHILESNKIVVVHHGHVPPYIIEDDYSELRGVNIDLMDALAKLLNVRVDYYRVKSLGVMFDKIFSNHYEVAIGPISNLPHRQQYADFINYARSSFALLVRKNSGVKILTIYDLCGLKIANTAYSSGEERLHKLSDVCLQHNLPPIKIRSYKDQYTSIFSVKLKISDAFLGGDTILSYYAMEDSDLEVKSIEKTEYLPDRYHAIMVAKNSPLSPAIRLALQTLIDNGTYMRIMNKWGLASKAIRTTDINLSE